jgi:hypothetical protein
MNGLTVRHFVTRIDLFAALRVPGLPAATPDERVRWWRPPAMSAADDRPAPAPRTAPMVADCDAEDRPARAAVAAARSSPDAPQRLPRMGARRRVMSALDGVRLPSEDRPGPLLAAPPMRTPDEHPSLAGGRPRWVATAQPMRVRRWAPTGERARWERSAPDERLGWAPDAPLSPMRSPQNPRPRRLKKRLPSPRPGRLAIETGADAAPRTLPIKEVVALPVVPPPAPLDLRARCLRLHSYSSRRLPAGSSGRFVSLSLPRRAPDPVRRP